MKPGLLFLVLALFLSQIWLHSPLKFLYGSPGDNYEYLAFQHLVKDNLLSGRFPLAHTDTLRFPVGFNLASGYDGAFAVFIGALFSLVLSPVLAYNLTVILILFLNLYLSYLFFRRLSASWPPALIACLLFAASPFALARLQAHLNLAFLVGFPLLGLALLHWRQSTSFKSLLFLQFAFFTLLAGSLQYLFLILYNLIVFGPLIYFLFPQIRPKLPTLNHFLLSCLVILPFYLYFFGGYPVAILTRQLFLIDKLANYLKFDQPWFIDLLIPNRYLSPIFSLFNHSPASIEKVVSLGFFGLGLIIYFLRSRKVILNIKIILGLSLSLFTILALGGLRLPLYPEGGREIVVLTFILAIIAVTHLGHLSQKHLYLLLCLLFLERLICFRPGFSPILPTAAASAAASLPGTASLNIPTSKYSAFYSSLPAFTHKKTIDGYFHFTADNAKSNQFLNQDLIQRFICQSEKALPENYRITPSDLVNTYLLLKSNDIKTIIVHKNGKLDYDECLQARNWWYQLNPPTAVLSAAIPQVTSFVREITGHPQFSFKFYAQKSGTFTLHGLFLTPDSLTTLSLTSPAGPSQTISLVPADNGVKNDHIPLFQDFVNAGESITLTSPIFPIKQTIYVTFWYTFEPTEVSPTIPLPFEPVYSDSEVEVYRLN